MGRVTTNLIATVTLALLAGTACRDAAAPVQEPVDPTGSLIGNLLTGNIAVGTTTTGSSLDPDGYTVTVDLLSSKSVATNGGVTFTVLTGVHTVVLSGVASNCTVRDGNTRVVTVLLGGTVGANFGISCAATGPTTGNLTVSVATTGSNPDPDGYTVTLNGGNSRTIGAPGGNNSTTYSGLTPGNYSVALNGRAANCTVSGPNPRSVPVTAGNTASTTFSVSCTATTPPPPPPPPPPGGARITGVGAIGARSQTFDFDATDAPGGRLRFTDLSAGATVTVDPATYPATGIRSFTRTSSACVTFGGTGRLETTGELVSFSIDGCDNGSPGVGRDAFTMSVPSHAYRASGTLTEGDITVSGGGGGAPPPPPPTGTRVTGRGAIGTGPATPGSDRLEFDFDVTSAPGGRVFVIDYSVVRSNGSAGSMTATAVTSFTRTSATCVRFGGRARLDTTEEYQFFIDACDNASPGAGADAFTVTLPDRPFTHSGTVSAGDIAITSSTS